MHCVCSNSHVTSALLERLKFRKKGKRAPQITWFALQARLKFKACMRFFLTKQRSISSEAICLKKSQKQTPKEQYNPQFLTPANYMNIKQLR